MALNTASLVIHRRGTREYIDADPTDIVLKSRGEATFVAGTKRFGNPVDRPLQSFRIIWAGDNGIYRQVGEEGASRRFDFIIVGNYDAVVAIGDYWKIGEQENRIEYIFPSNGYEVKAGGISHGPKPTGA